MPRGRLTVLALLLPLLGAGCTESVVSIAKQGIEAGIQKGGRLIQESGSGFVRNLTDTQKRAVDGWLSANNLNEFGDAFGTFYAGGTPLFDEATGATIDRFKYLFEKFPELKRVIEEELKKQRQDNSL